jgi:hypothetical protein
VDEQRADVAETSWSDRSERQKEGEPDPRCNCQVTAEVGMTASGK